MNGDDSPGMPSSADHGFTTHFQEHNLVVDDSPRITRAASKEAPITEEAPIAKEAPINKEVAITEETLVTQQEMPITPPPKPSGRKFTFPKPALPAFSSKVFNRVGSFRHAQPPNVESHDAESQDVESHDVEKSPTAESAHFWSHINIPHGLNMPRGINIPNNMNIPHGLPKGLPKGMTNLMSNVDIDIDLDGYFVGPRNTETHSKYPIFLRLHGSIAPRMMLPMLTIILWSIIVTGISQSTHSLGVSPTLLTVLGFVVGLALSFRGSTAYERYSDGRKCWATISVQSRNLARYIWVHITERPGEQTKEDLLKKLTAINLIRTFAVSLMHRLRFEPYAYYPDIASLTTHLDTYAKAAETPEVHIEKKRTWWKSTGEYLGLTFATSNPRKAIKRATRPVGNLPLETLMYLSEYFEMSINNGTLSSTIVYGQVLNSLAALTDAMSGAERVLNTPLPAGYNIIISQIVILYVYLLPFQLNSVMGWLAVPGTAAAAYIMLGLAAIGNELENPFGNNVNDLPLDQYCNELARELDIITSVPAPKFDNFMDECSSENKVLWPLSLSSAADWRSKSVDDIRAALRTKVVIGEKKSAKPKGFRIKSRAKLSEAEGAAGVEA